MYLLFLARKSQVSSRFQYELHCPDSLRSGNSKMVHLHPRFLSGLAVQAAPAGGRSRYQARLLRLLAMQRVRLSDPLASLQECAGVPRVDARAAHLRPLEAKLTDLITERAASPASAVDAPDSGFDHQLGQPEPQDLTKSADVDAPSSSSLNGANQDNATHTESETTPGSSAQETGDTSPAAPVKATAAVTAPDQESSGPLPSTTPTPATPGIKAPTSRARTTRRAPTKQITPAKQSSSSATVRRATTRKPVTRSKPEASNGNKSE